MNSLETIFDTLEKLLEKRQLKRSMLEDDDKAVNYADGVIYGIIQSMDIIEDFIDEQCLNGAEL